jgi:phenylacetate-coenzyme A ligase PaaK-like adenylate-forming protein
MTTPSQVVGVTRSRRPDNDFSVSEFDFYDRIIARLPTTLELEHVGAHVLAPLLGPPTYEPFGYMNTVGFRSLQDRLIDLTIRRAKLGCSDYANSISDIEDGWTYERLKDLPTLTRESLNERRTGYISELTQGPAMVAFTTGSTSGVPLMIERSAGEQEYLRQYHTFLNEMAGQEPGEQQLSLNLGSLAHGDTPSIPRPSGYAFQVDARGASGLERAAWLLNQTYEWEGFSRTVRTISGSFFSVYTLMTFLRSMGKLSVDLPLDNVWCSGHYVPLSVRRELEAFYGCTVSDRYSMCEVMGSAPYHAALNAYVFEPSVVAEVIHPDTRERTSERFGELVLTTLFPFTQRFPLIRYRTGDLVEQFVPNGQQNVVCYRPLGRIKNCVRLSSGRWVSSARVVDALTGEAGLNIPTGEVASGARLGKAILPYHSLEPTAAGGARVVVETSFLPQMFPAAARDLERRLRGRLCEALELYHTEGNALVLELVPPGTLAASGRRHFV